MSNLLIWNYSLPIKIKKENDQNSFQELVKISSIEKNKITFLDGTSVLLLKVQPINFKLKSKLEQNAILHEYKRFLKNINQQIQILVSTKKTDVSYHLQKILQSTKDNPKLLEMSQDYIMLVNKIVSEKNTITKEFYIVLENIANAQNEIMKITENLSGCGNEVEECTKEETINLIANFLNNRIVNL